MPDGASGQGRTANGVQVIARAAAILRALKDQKEGLSLGQIATRVGLPRSTVQRIVNALLSERLVMAASPEGRLRLGPEIHTLAASGRLDVAKIAHPHLVALSRATGETVDLAILRGDHLLFVDQVVGQQRLRAVSAVGEAFPLTNTANGKACLSLLDDEAVATLATQEWQAGRGARRKLSDFFTEIERVRQDGVALDTDEHSMGISAVGTAFRDPMGDIYAVSIPVPSSRMGGRQQALAEALLAARSAIMAALT